MVALGRSSHKSSPRSLSLMNPCEEFFGQNTEYSSSFANAPASLSSHEGEEFIVVVSGEVELVYGKETFLLHPGDSMYYNSVVQHLVRAANGKPATIYAVVYMPL